MFNIEEDLNEKQREAVVTTEGPVLVLAGAGTGKTRVITYRIAHLIRDKEVSPGNILAVTFTNKAAGEMKSRMKELVGALAEAVHMGTFHSICLNILRKDGDKVGLPSSFAVADQEDRAAIMRDAVKDLNIDKKQFPPRQYNHIISAFKNTEKYVQDLMPEETMHRLVDVYKSYQEALRSQRLIDFDDMISLVVRLFDRNRDVLEEYREVYKYILVDEYQDTNTVQSRLLRLLAGERGNLCVVGDDDQSIYGWRGAEVRNILDFDKVFKDVKEIKLEGNYRSGKTILSAANRLIKYNRNRRGKTLEASSDKAADVRTCQFSGDKEEAEGVAALIENMRNKGEDLSDIAILYRTNAQSRNFEVALNKLRIPYKVIGGVGFYMRKEIKDILSYLKVLDNPYDIVSFRRSVKVPPRHVGDASIDKLASVAAEKGISILEAAAQDMDAVSRNRNALDRYLEIMDETDKTGGIKNKIETVTEKINYIEYLKQTEDPDEVNIRIENIMELYSAAAAFEEQNPEASLKDFLAGTALITSSDEADTEEGAVKMMTMHAAKGLEFKRVFLTGLEEGLFPLSTAEEEGKVEEERRLCYVGITRAMETLYVTRAASRYKNGRHSQFPDSRFLREMEQDASFKFERGIMKSIFGKSNEKSLNSRQKEYNGNGEGKFKISSKVRHSVFGEGTVLFSEGKGIAEKVTVHFKKNGIKKIIASFLDAAD